MKKSAGNKLLFAFLAFVVLGAAFYGYRTQSAQLKPEAEQTSPAADKQAAAPKDNTPAASPDASIFKSQSGDIVLGKTEAPVTLIEYASLSCPHCAHFHQEILPELKKQYIETGKAKLYFRHFPLNAPALRAAQLVECADPGQREKFLDVLFELQAQWATGDDYQDKLKQIAGVGGIDSARFDACMNNKSLENRIVATRQKGTDEAKVDATPTLFINGVKFQGGPDIDAIGKAIDSAKK